MNSTLRVIQINKQGSATYVVVSDSNELERDSVEKNNLFREESEKFLQEKYEEYLSILSSTLDHQGETQGSAWIRVNPRTSGIIEMIAKEYGLKIESIS